MPQKQFIVELTNIQALSSVPDYYKTASLLKPMQNNATWSRIRFVSWTESRENRRRQGLSVDSEIE